MKTRRVVTWCMRRGWAAGARRRGSEKGSASRAAANAWREQRSEISATRRGAGIFSSLSHIAASAAAAQAAQTAANRYRFVTLWLPAISP